LGYITVYRRVELVYSLHRDWKQIKRKQNRIAMYEVHW